MKSVAIVALVLALGLNAIAERPATPKEFNFQDLYGADVTLSPVETRPACVLFFFSNTCPVARRYVPRMIQLAEDYRARGIQFIAVNVSQDDTLDDVARFAWEYGLTFPVVKDPQFDAVKALGISRTPEVAVLDRNFSTVYRGRIDDQYRLGGVRPQATRHDLVEALDALLDGRPVPASHVPAEGCVVTVSEDITPAAQFDSEPDQSSYNVEWVGTDGGGEDSPLGHRSWILGPAMVSTAWIKGMRVDGTFESARVYYVEQGKDVRHYLAGALLPGRPVRWNEDEAVQIPAGVVPWLDATGEIPSAPIVRMEVTDAAPVWAITCIESPFVSGAGDHGFPMTLLQHPIAERQPRYVSVDIVGHRSALTIELLTEEGPPRLLFSLPVLDPREPGPHPLPESPSTLTGKGQLGATLERPGYLTWPTAGETTPERAPIMYTYWASRL